MGGVEEGGKEGERGRSRGRGKGGEKEGGRGRRRKGEGKRGGGQEEKGKEREGRERNDRGRKGGLKGVCCCHYNCSLTSHVKACTVLSSVAMATRSFPFFW